MAPTDNETADLRRDIAQLGKDIARLEAAQSHYSDEARRERHDARDKLNQVSLALQAHATEDRANFARINEQLDGTAEFPGIRERLARREGFDKGVQRLLWASTIGGGGALLTLLGKMVFAWVETKAKGGP